MLRQCPERSIILTGGTGFLGSFLLAELLGRGYQVTVLGRSSCDMGLADRLARLMRWFGVAPGEQLRTVEVDLAKERMGLDSAAYRSLCAAARQIIHCASDTSFAERNRARVMEANVDNLLPLLDFAADAGNRHICYLSTAYAAGRCEGICLEKPIITDNFTNVYEESKAQAEGIVERYCTDKGMRLSILRPSIVYGHSKTGISLKFNALYYPVKSLLHIRDIFMRDIDEQGGKRSQKWGIRRGDDGIIRLPLDIYLRRDGAINLIPVDHFIAVALRILEHPDSHGVYHITSDTPADMPTLIEYSERFLGLRGIRAIWEPADENIAPNPAEELFDRLIEQYRPYLSDLRSFDQSRTQGIAQDHVAPPFTYDVFERCMSYAVACDWGGIDDPHH